MIPSAEYGNDTLEYTLEYEPDPGYVMEIDPYSIEDDGEYLDEDGWGYDSTTKKLKMPLSSQMNLTVRFTQQHYDVKFSIPTDADVFVANKKVDGQYIVDWYDTLLNTTVNEVRAPEIYDVNGCRINWKVADSEEHSATYIYYELPYMTSLESSETKKNVLVPDMDHPDCPTAEGVYFYKQTLTVEGEGTIRLEQVLNMTVEDEEDPTQIVLSHPFVDDIVLNPIPRRRVSSLLSRWNRQKVTCWIS